MLRKDLPEGLSFKLGSGRQVGVNRKEGDSQGKKFLCTQGSKSKGSGVGVAGGNRDAGS